MMKDKKYHVLAGLLIAVAVGLPAYLESVNLFAGLWASLTSGVIAGGVKEWCDNKYNWEWDWRDFAATCLGAVIVALFIIGLHFGKG